MGILDSDDHHDAFRNASSLKQRRQSPSMKGVALFWIAVLAIAYAIVRLVPTIWPPTPEVAPAPTGSTPARTVPPRLPPAPPARSMSDAAGRAAESPAAPIYRCGNRYTHEPCAGGRVVDESVTSGFDSRPSERLARLVAEGRSVGNEIVTSNRTVTTVSGNSVTVGSAEVADRFGLCQTLSAEVAAIDDAARQLRSAPEQDDLRARRKIARDRQVGLHC